MDRGLPGPGLYGPLGLGRAAGLPDRPLPGQGATQDLHLLRFANELFASMWNRRHIEAVQIDVPEKLGITDRSKFYDSTGAVLDMSSPTCSRWPPRSPWSRRPASAPLDPQTPREKVIKSFRPLDPAEVILGRLTGHRDVPRVAAKSGWDTYVAARKWIGNPRWRGVPLYLRTGKQLAASRQQVSVILREPAEPLAGQLPAESSVLSFSRCPATGRSACRWWPKKPGPGLDLDRAQASIPLSGLKGANPLPPYVRLIHDVLGGDRSLFTRPDGLAAVWKGGRAAADEPAGGQALRPGSWGPADARKLVATGRWLLGQ